MIPCRAMSRAIPREAVKAVAIADNDPLGIR
jgi:hypothetical protein